MYKLRKSKEIRGEADVAIRADMEYGTVVEIKLGRSDLVLRLGIKPDYIDNCEIIEYSIEKLYEEENDHG